MPDRTYDQSFSRNIGILTSAEQKRLSTCSVAIAGIGGIGSNSAITLARMGVGKFRLADFDRFEYANINRQYGAFVDTIGHSKVDVVAHEIRRINPQAEVYLEPKGFSRENAARLLDGADLVIDAIDFYSIAAHLDFHREARQKRLFVLMGSPVGFSACLQVFDPEGMSIEEYCGIEPKMLALEKQLRYACGVVPNLAHVDYFDVSRGSANTNFLKKTGPSLACATVLAASLVASEAIILLLRRRKPRAIPYSFQFDPYTFRYEKAWVEGGMKNYDIDRALTRIPDRLSLIPLVLRTLYKRRKAQRAKVNGAELYYEIEGKGECLLFLNPLGADLTFWARQISALSKNYRVIAFDGRGSGFSTDANGNLSTQQMAEDAAALLRNLGITRTHVVGLALGGLVAQHLAAAYPSLVDRLVLMSSYAKANVEMEQTVGKWQEIANTQGMQELFDVCAESLFSKQYLDDPDGDFDKMRTFFHLNLQKPANFLAQSRAGLVHDSLSILHNIQSPTLVLYGEADRVVSPELGEHLAANIANSRLLVIPGAAHFLSWERPDTVNQELLAFLTTPVYQPQAMSNCAR